MGTPGEEQVSVTQSRLDKAALHPWQSHQCSPDLCRSEGDRDFWHREVPEQFTPYEDGDPDAPTVTWSLARHDELDGAGVVTDRTVYAVHGIGREQAHSSLDETESYAFALLRMVSRGRRLL